MKKKYTKKQIQEAINYWTKQLIEGNYRTIDESLNYEDVMYSLNYHKNEGNNIKFIADDCSYKIQLVKKDGNTLIINAGGRPDNSEISTGVFVAMIQDAGFNSPDDIQKVVLQFPNGQEYILYQTFNRGITSKVYGRQSETLEWYFRKSRQW